MKRRIWTVALIGLTLLVASCGGGDTGPVEVTDDDIQRISALEARLAVANNVAVLVDVRPASEYEELHTTGAISFPEEEAAGRLGELPTDKDLIFYCDTPNEEQSARVAILAVENGIPLENVLALKGGFEPWTGAGYPTTSGSGP